MHSSVQTNLFLKSCVVVALIIGISAFAFGILNACIDTLSEGKWEGGGGGQQRRLPIHKRNALETGYHYLQPVGLLSMQRNSQFRFEVPETPGTDYVA